MMSRGVMTIRPMVIDRGGGACEKSQAPFFVLSGKNQRDSVHFLARSEKTNQKRGATPKAPFKGGCKKFFAKTDEKF